MFQLRKVQTQSNERQEVTRNRRARFKQNLSLDLHQTFDQLGLGIFFFKVSFVPDHRDGPNLICIKTFINPNIQRRKTTINWNQTKNFVYPIVPSKPLLIDKTIERRFKPPKTQKSSFVLLEYDTKTTQTVTNTQVALKVTERQLCRLTTRLAVANHCEDKA